jgi:hypothetical protein
VNLAGAIGRAFRAAKERLTSRVPKPAARKSKRTGGDEKGQPPPVMQKRTIPKILQRFRKGAWDVGGADDRPTFNHEEFHRWQQSGGGSAYDSSVQTHLTNYPSLTL